MMQSQWVQFDGSFYLGQSKGTTILGMSFASSGLIPRVFGINRLNLFNLFLAGEIGITGGVPSVESIQVGGASVSAIQEIAWSFSIR
jgi:hypothetical protein